MFPLIDTGDPASELAQASPDLDDIGWAALTYPEGTAASGPAALQAGDVAFTSQWGLITGEVRHGVLNQPIAGANVYAVDRSNNSVAVSAISGTTNLSFNPLNGGLFFVPNVAQAIVNGNYAIPVPQGNYSVGVEPMDGLPVAGAQVNFTPRLEASSVNTTSSKSFGITTMKVRLNAIRVTRRTFTLIQVSLTVAPISPPML